MAPPIKQLSECISDPIIKSYKTGGLGLVFVFVGTLFLLFAVYVREGILSYLIAILGSLMVISMLCLFYFKDIKKLKEFNANIKNNSELINTIQATAVRMTDFAYDLQSLAFKNANEITETIKIVRQKLKDLENKKISLQIVDKVSSLADNKYVSKTDNLSKSVVEFTVLSKEVIENVKTSLIESNPNILKGYLKQIGDLDDKTKKLLSY